MTQEELSNALGVPVSVPAYIKLDLLYLRHDFADNLQFLHALCAYFPLKRDRKELVNALTKLAAFENLLDTAFSKRKL